jgi:hypothetical protein
MVIEVDLRLHLRLDLRLFHFSFWAHGFPRLSMDGPPQATVVLFPCSLSQGFKEATMGITSCASCLLVCLFVLFLAPQSVARGGSIAYTGLSRI